MHKTFNRLQSICSFTFNATVVLLFFIASITYLTSPKLPACNLTIHEFVNSENGAFLKFSPNIDLTSQYNPCLKQIFLYLKVVYGGNREEVVWSKIIKRSDVKVMDAVVHNNYRFAYPPIKDRVYFELCGNYIPFVGAIGDKVFGRYVVR